MAVFFDPLTGQIILGPASGSALVTSVNGQLGAVTLDAVDIPYDNSVSGLTATETQSAIDEIQLTIDSLPNPIVYKGVYNATTNTPALSNTDTDVTGFLYQVNVAGTQNFGAGNISFEVGDKVVNDGSAWQKWDMTDAVASVNGLTGIVVLDTDNIAEGTNLYFTDERAQDSIGTILVDSSSIDFTYNDATPSITAAVLPAGVDHDQLLNFVANEHVDHSTVQITTITDSGLTGGGDITATRNLSVDINGTTAETTPSNLDKILIYDTSATALKSMTRENFLSGVPLGSAGDINETSFSLANNQSTPADVTGFVFTAGVVRSFEALVSVEINATAELYEVLTLRGIQKNGSFEMSITSNGDESGVVFSITSTGQIQYIGADNAGFVSGLIRFRSQTTSI